MIANKRYTTGGFLLVLVIFLANVIFTYTNIRSVDENNRRVAHTRQVVGEVRLILVYLTDAETGQRGYLLTGRADYLAPYRKAVTALEAGFDRLANLTVDNPIQQGRIAELRKIAAEKLSILDRTITLRRDQDLNAALDVVRSDQGKIVMDRARVVLADMEREEEGLLIRREAASRLALRRTLAIFMGTTILALGLLSLVAYLKRRQDADRERAAEAIRQSENWLSTTMTSIGDAVIATDGMGNVRFLNPVAETLTGWINLEAAGRRLEEVFVIVNETTRKPVESPVDRVIREGVVVGLANHTVIIARDGRETAIEDSAAPIKDKDGNVIGVVMVFQDATERRNYEKSLKEGEERLRLATEATDLGIWDMDVATGVVVTNDNTKAVFGLAIGEELTYEKFIESLPVEDRERVHEANQQALRGVKGGRYQVEYRAIGRSDGVERWVAANGQAYFDAGKPTRFIGTVLDITERKRNEVSLREGEERYRTILESITDAFYAIDREWRFAYLNRRAELFLGRSRDEMIGGKVWEIYPDAVGSDFYTAYHRSMGGEVVKFEAYYPPHNRWYELNAYPSENGISVYFRDISERKRAEEEKTQLMESSEKQRRIYETALSNTPDFNYVFDLDGRLIYVNAALLDLWQKQLDEALGKNFFELHYPHELAETLQRQIQQVIDTRQPIRDETTFTSHLGERMYEYILVPVLGADGAIEAVTGSTRDITDRKRVEDEVRAAKEEAEHANQAKDRFLAVLSHELRTPLNPILLASTSMLERTPDPDEVRPTLEMIRQNVMLQSRLIDDLLDVMRIVRGKMPLQWEVADCHKLISQSVQICQSEVFGKELRLDMELEAREHHLNADPARFQQVIWNLIKNAVKFTPGGGTITIRTRNEPGEGVGNLVIEVTDTGIGIESDILPLIFDPFQQGETRITRKFGGLGLGLAICRGIVESHGGTLIAESEGKDRGTKFTIDLKAIPSPTTTSGEPTTGTPMASTAAPSSMKLLVVEDEPATLRLMGRLMRQLGHEVTMASTTASALAAVESDIFDMIVSDIGLPDGSGLELMRQVVAIRGPVPAIALTGYGMEADIQRSRDAGFTAHLTKPIDFTKLEAMIRQVMTQSNRQTDHV